MDPIVEAGIVGAGAALLASLLTGLLTTRVTITQVRSAERLARQGFLSGRQADTYVAVCDQVARAEAWANVVSDTARGRASSLDPVPLLTGDRWFELQGGLRVFGSRVARDEFDSLIQAAWQLRALEAAASQGNPAAAGDVEDALGELRHHAARLRTAVSAEIGPLYDILDRTPPRWWRPSSQARRDTAASSAAIPRPSAQTADPDASWSVSQQVAGLPQSGPIPADPPPHGEPPASHDHD